MGGRHAQQVFHRRTVLRLEVLLLEVLIFGTLLFGAPGCAHVPGVPAGPIGGPGVRVGATYAFAYAPAKAQTINRSGSPYTLRGDSAIFAGSLPFIPLRAMVRASPATFLDVGADIGWLDAGLQLRAGWLDAHRQLPLGLELEWRTGQPALFNDDLVHQTRVYRARGELYPRLGRWAALDTFGVLTLGVSSGAMGKYMFVPDSVEGTIQSPIPAGLSALRSETRLEMSLGAHARGPVTAFTIAFMPWLALHQGRASQSFCDACSLELRELSSPWGVSIVASGSLVLEKK